MSHSSEVGTMTSSARSRRSRITVLCLDEIGIYGNVRGGEVKGSLGRSKENQGKANIRGIYIQATSRPSLSSMAIEF
jgi:hypothetical protein